MSDPTIEAVAQALEHFLDKFAPLIRADALEEGATRLLELAREERNLDGATLSRAAEYLRAFKTQPKP